MSTAEPVEVLDDVVGATVLDAAGLLVARPRLEQLGVAGEQLVFMAGTLSAGLSFSAGRAGIDCCDDLRGRAWAEHLCHRERLPVVDICDRFLLSYGGPQHVSPNLDNSCGKEKDLVGSGFPADLFLYFALCP